MRKPSAAFIFIGILLGILFGMWQAIDAQGPIGRFTRLILNNTIQVLTGTGTPEGATTAPVSSVFLRTDGGTDTTFYVKETGAGNTGWKPLISSAVNAASPTTFTNKTLDVEATGNVITTVQKITWRGARCDNTTATAIEWNLPSTNSAVPACDTGTNIQKGVLDFADGAVTISAQTSTTLPSDFAGTADAKFVWYTTAIAGAVVWQVSTICVADAETGDPAFNAASTVTDTAKGTTNQYNDAAIAGITITGCAAGETMYVRAFRDPTNGADTLAATARLVALELTYRRAQ